MNVNLVQLSRLWMCYANHIRSSIIITTNVTRLKQHLYLAIHVIVVTLICYCMFSASKRSRLWINIAIISGCQISTQHLFLPGPVHGSWLEGNSAVLLSVSVHLHDYLYKIYQMCLDCSHSIIGHFKSCTFYQLDGKPNLSLLI